MLKLRGLWCERIKRIMTLHMHAMRAEMREVITMSVWERGDLGPQTSQLSVMETPTPTGQKAPREATLSTSTLAGGFLGGY